MKVYLLNSDGYVDIYGYGDGYGYGHGSGFGYGSGNGYGHGNGYGDQYGNGDGDGKGYGFGYRYGSGASNGNGHGNGNGYDIYLAKIWGEWFEVSGKIENSLCINIPEHHYDKIDRDFIQRVDNLESLRMLREKIGLDRYITLLDAKVIDEQIDNQGNAMKLYQYEEQGEDVILLEVICPSTGRLYHLYPPDQSAKDCWQAKASTFGNKSIAYRHGDVGLLKVDAEGTVTLPFSET